MRMCDVDLVGRPPGPHLTDGAGRRGDQRGGAVRLQAQVIGLTIDIYSS